MALFQLRLLHLAQFAGGLSDAVIQTWPQAGLSHFHALAVTTLMLPIVAGFITNGAKTASPAPRRAICVTPPTHQHPLLPRFTFADRLQPTHPAPLPSQSRELIEKSASLGLPLRSVYIPAFRRTSRVEHHFQHLFSLQSTLHSLPQPRITHTPSVSTQHAPTQQRFD